MLAVNAMKQGLTGEMSNETADTSRLLIAVTVVREPLLESNRSH